MKALLNRVLNNDLCSGCGMCSSVAEDDAIKIRLTGDGYHRPVLNSQYQDKPVASEQTSAAFAKSCPALNLDIRPYKSANYHPIWGEILDTLKGYAADDEIRQAGLYKEERILAGPQETEVTVADGRKLINMCANNYLGLANHPEIVEAAIDTLKQWGYVR